MPVVQFHVSGIPESDDVIRSFLEQASALYAQILQCPIDRVRAFYVPHEATMTAIKGRVSSERVVFFEFIILEGRALEQGQKIAKEFTRLAERMLSVDVGLIRGQCIRVAPEDWCIAGQFANELRKSEIEARKIQ